MSFYTPFFNLSDVQVTLCKDNHEATQNTIAAIANGARASPHFAPPFINV